MNFTGRMEGPEIQVELKYCERCGGLWLRPQGADGVYCAGCRVCLAALPDPASAPSGRARRRKERMQGTDSQGEQLDDSVRIGCLQGVAAMGVWA
jgi:hypothetical protein